MGTEVMVLRPWSLALAIGLLLAGCAGGESTDATVRSLVPEAFAACMIDAGYSLEDFADRFEPPTAGELEGEPVRGGGEPDWDLELQFGTCINHSGIGESAVGDPEASARNTEIAMALTRCMKDRGWSEFPDPVPHPAPYDDGLIHTRIDMPADPEARDAFNADFGECGEEAGMAVDTGELDR